MANDGGPAFPRPHSHMMAPSQTGMTLRQHYAGQAMMGVIGDGHTMWDSSMFQCDTDQIADFAFRMADSMIERSKK
jgi:hypothetical protein